MSDSDVLIIGAGCFGLSTALHLKRRGVSRVTLIDKEPFPSIDAASNDSSRIVRADYKDPFYAKLAREAYFAWLEDPLFKPHFHKTGWIAAEIKGAGFVEKTVEILRDVGVEVEKMAPEGCAARFPALNGPMEQWDMYFNPEAGWAHARQALCAVMDSYKSMGGNFISGEQGEAISFEADPNDANAVIGVRTRDGSLHTAKKIICCTGAFTPWLLDVGTQIHPVGLCVAHWHLSAEEMRVWKDHPVVDLHRHGYFFPPNEEGVMKMGIGMISYHNIPAGADGGKALISKPLRSLRIPKEAEDSIRWILNQAAPSLADKPFFDTKICWDGMTADHHWLITPYPQKKNLFIAAGGTGHLFKFFPVIGKYVLEMVDDNLPQEMTEKWRWKQGTENVALTMQGRKMKDLKASL